MRQKLVPFIDEKGKRWDHFYVDPATDVIYFKKGHAGRKYKFSTGETKDRFTAAQRVANKKFNELIGNKPKIRTLIKDELELWLKMKEGEGHKYDTLNNIRRAKRDIEEYWGDRFPLDICNPDNITAWQEWWAKRYPNKQMENAVKYMRNFGGYLAQKIIDGRPLIPAAPSISDPKYKEIRRARKEKKSRIITGTEFVIIRRVAPPVSETVTAQDIGLVAALMYTMATRIEETLGLRFGREIILDEEPRYQWADGQNKANLDGWHHLPPSLIDPLKQLRARRQAEGTDQLFPQAGDNRKPIRAQMINWDKWRESANLGWHWTAHTFRHTCLSNLFNNPQNPQALICKLYRVSLPVAMETYIKPTPEGRALMRSAIEVPPCDLE